jgi:hypothetical protein
MPWTANRWPPAKGLPIDTDMVINELRSALVERSALVYAGYVPAAFARWAPLRGTPAGRGAAPYPTLANFQYEIAKMLELAQPLRWWDESRETLYTAANLYRDAFNAAAWTWDLTATDAGGVPINRWAPAAAVFFTELYEAINRLDCVRVLPTVSASATADSVGRLTTGIANWPQQRAATFALFDGADDGQVTSLAYDVGLGGEVLDGGGSQQWTLESRRFSMIFATAALAGCTVRRAWLDFTTAAPAGSADFSDAFTAQVIDGAGTSLGSFVSTDVGAKHIEVPPASVLTGGDTTLTVRSARPDAADRPAWAPAGPNYSGTYREGLAVTGAIRLIVEVDFEYRG